MGRKENCWDNAVAESFFSGLKKERIKKHISKNRELATADISDYIESFYNRIRRHSYLGGVSPEEVSTKSWELQVRLSRLPTWSRLDKFEGEEHVRVLARPSLRTGLVNTYIYVPAGFPSVRSGGA